MIFDLRFISGLEIKVKYFEKNLKVSNFESIWYNLNNTKIEVSNPCY